MDERYLDVSVVVLQLGTWSDSQMIPTDASLEEQQQVVERLQDKIQASLPPEAADMRQRWFVRLRAITGDFQPQKAEVQHE